MASHFHNYSNMAVLNFQELMNVFFLLAPVFWQNQWSFNYIIPRYANAIVVPGYVSVKIFVS